MFDSSSLATQRYASSYPLSFLRIFPVEMHPIDMSCTRTHSKGISLAADFHLLTSVSFLQVVLLQESTRQGKLMLKVCQTNVKQTTESVIRPAIP